MDATKAGVMAGTIAATGGGRPGAAQEQQVQEDHSPGSKYPYRTGEKVISKDVVWQGNVFRNKPCPLLYLSHLHHCLAVPCPQATRYMVRQEPPAILVIVTCNRGRRLVYTPCFGSSL